MIQRLCILIVMLCGCICSYSQAPTDSMSINVALKEEYVIGDTIYFENINSSKKRLYVHISLERIDDEGKWDTFFDEIYVRHGISNEGDTVFTYINGHMSLSKFSYMPIEKCRNDTWIIKNDCLYGNEAIAMFRFKYSITQIPYGFVYKETQKAPGKTVCYSKPFYI